MQVITNEKWLFEVSGGAVTSLPDDSANGDGGGGGDSGGGIQLQLTPTLSSQSVAQAGADQEVANAAPTVSGSLAAGVQAAAGPCISGGLTNVATTASQGGATPASLGVAFVIGCSTSAVSAAALNP